MNLIVKTKIEAVPPLRLMELFRNLFRDLRERKECESFIPINRGIDRRVDCYVFGCKLAAAEILAHFPSEIAAQSTIDKSDDSPDLELVRAASIVVDQLLTNYSDDKIYNALLSEHIHYIMNSLGNNYLEESSHYHHWSILLLQRI